MIPPIDLFSRPVLVLGLSCSVSSVLPHSCSTNSVAFLLFVLHHLVFDYFLLAPYFSSFLYVYARTFNVILDYFFNWVIRMPGFLFSFLFFSLSHMSPKFLCRRPFPCYMISLIFFFLHPVIPNDLLRLVFFLDFFVWPPRGVNHSKVPYFDIFVFLFAWFVFSPFLD